MTKTTRHKQPKRSFQSALSPWAWNVIPPGGIPARDRCQSVGTDQERAKAAALVAEYRQQEGISASNDIESMAKELDQLARTSKNAHGGIEGEMMRRRMTAADHEKYEAAQAKLAELRPGGNGPSRARASPRAGVL